jgi:hypothetical protein
MHCHVPSSAEALYATRRLATGCYARIGFPSLSSVVSPHSRLHFLEVSVCMTMEAALDVCITVDMSPLTLA